ncbi:PIG-L deacetylase family protein [Streptomyces sp. YIM S03343]
MAADSLTAAIDAGAPLVVLSPHLDDAVLSCGALMAHAGAHTTVLVVTFFTEAGVPPYTLSGRRFLHRAGQRDAGHLYRDRRAEDREVLEGLGADWVHLGLTDGLFRRKPAVRAGRPGLADRMLPERAHVYPSYRLHISTGRISRYDTGTLARVCDLLEELASPPHTVLLAPCGVGGHVDHMLVRTAAEFRREPVIYYSDFPYNQRHRPDPRFVSRNALTEVIWPHGLAAKADLVRGYRSQTDVLFPGGRVPAVPETYLLPDAQLASSDP